MTATARIHRGSAPVHSPRPRRFRRTRAALATAAGYLHTATLMTRNGIPVEVAERYSGQVTRTATQHGATSAATTYTKRNGRWQHTQAFDLATTALRLLLALVTYRPAAPRLLRNGQPSRAKTEVAKAEKRAAYVRAIGSLALVTA